MAKKVSSKKQQAVHDIFNVIKFIKKNMHKNPQGFDLIHENKTFVL